MTYTTEDIEVFVRTYNRGELLRQTLDSILCQTAKKFQITVINNGSADNTHEILLEFQKKHKIRIYTNENLLDSTKMFHLVQKLAEKAWTVVFHDDDLMHPQYIEHVLMAINETNNVALVASGMSCEYRPRAMWVPFKMQRRIFSNVADFAAVLFDGFFCNFGSVVYRTDILKKSQTLEETYGKVEDRPFLFMIAKQGKVILFPAPYIKYRVHGAQDSSDKTTGPYLDELLALHKLYFELLGDNWRTRKGRTFIFNNYRILRNIYLFTRESTPYKYYRQAVLAGATSRKAFIVGKGAYPFNLFSRFVMRLIRRFKIIVQHFCEKPWNH